MVNPSTDENRRARSMRRASSEKRSSGSPIQRIVRDFISFSPSNGSIKPILGLYAIPFMVKSRRERSSLMFRENVTELGCLPSAYSPSTRNVVISMLCPLYSTVTVPCFIPVSTTLQSEKTRSVSLGGGYVIVVRLISHKRVADAPSDNKRVIARAFETFEYLGYLKWKFHVTSCLDGKLSLS